MKKVNYRTLPNRLSLALLALLLTFSVSTQAFTSTPLPVQAADTLAGKNLFNANCAACHKLYNKAVGPALFQVGDKYEKEWLYTWIANSKAFVDSGDPRAIAIFEEYKGSIMTPFPALTNEDIDNIIAYTYTRVRYKNHLSFTTCTKNDRYKPS